MLKKGNFSIILMSTADIIRLCLQQQSSSLIERDISVAVNVPLIKKMDVHLWVQSCKKHGQMSCVFLDVF